MVPFPHCGLTEEEEPQEQTDEAALLLGQGVDPPPLVGDGGVGEVPTGGDGEGGEGLPPC